MHFFHHTGTFAGITYKENAEEHGPAKDITRAISQQALRPDGMVDSLLDTSPNIQVTFATLLLKNSRNNIFRW